MAYCVYTYRNLMMTCCLQCTYISLLIWGSISPCKLEKQSLLIWSDHALLFYLFQFQGCILHDNRHTTKTSQWFCLFGDLHRYCLGAVPWQWRWTNFCPGSIAGKLPDPLALASRGTSQALLEHTSVISMYPSSKIERSQLATHQKSANPCPHTNISPSVCLVCLFQ